MADQRKSTTANTTPRRNSSGRFMKSSRPRRPTAQQHRAPRQDDGQMQRDAVVPPLPPSSPLDPSMSDEQRLAAGRTVEEHALSLERVESAIAYTKSRLSQALPILQTTRFSIQLPTASVEPPAAHIAALSLLRSGPATVISTSDTHEVFEIGIPDPYMVVGSVGHTRINDPHWWMDKSAAEVKAGPFAEVADLRKAQAKIKELETKKRKQRGPTQKQMDIDWKLAEGLTRQEAGLGMYDEDVEGRDIAMAEDFVDHEDDEQQDVHHNTGKLDDEEDEMETSEEGSD